MFNVHITRGAENDIKSIMDYLIGRHDMAVAGELWDSFEQGFASLHKFPLRGHLPPELAEYPDKRIREIHISVYRLIYRVIENDVYILFVADARRSIQADLLERALRFGA